MSEQEVFCQQCSWWNLCLCLRAMCRTFLFQPPTLFTKVNLIWRDWVHESQICKERVIQTVWGLCNCRGHGLIDNIQWSCAESCTLSGDSYYNSLWLNASFGTLISSQTPEEKLWTSPESKITTSSVWKVWLLSDWQVKHKKFWLLPLRKYSMTVGTLSNKIRRSCVSVIINQLSDPDDHKPCYLLLGQVLVK